MQRIFLLMLFVLVGTSGPSWAKVVWRGDFESGDRSQFSSAQMVDPNRLQVVSSPVRKGQKALRVEVRQGDDPISASGHRNELVYFDSSREGTEYYYAWSTLLPQDYPLAAAWQVLIQWHHPGCCGAPPLRLVLGCSAGDCGQSLPKTLFFIVDGKTVWKLPEIQVGQWQDFILHVKWSASSSQGFVELWHNGKRVVPKTFTRTLFATSDVNYLKLGLYRDVSIQKTGVLFHDQLTQTTTLEEAQAALAANASPPPPPPSPSHDGGTTSSPDGGSSTPLPEDPPVPNEDLQTSIVPDDTDKNTAVRGCNSVSGATLGLWGWVMALGLRRTSRKRTTSP